MFPTIGEVAAIRCYGKCRQFFLDEKCCAQTWGDCSYDAILAQFITCIPIYLKCIKNSYGLLFHLIDVRYRFESKAYQLDQLNKITQMCQPSPYFTSDSPFFAWKFRPPIPNTIWKYNKINTKIAMIINVRTRSRINEII